MNKKRIAQALRCARTRAGLTQQKVAEVSGYSPRQVQRYESAGTKDLNVIEVFAHVYNVHPAVLIFDQTEAEVALNALASYLSKGHLIK